METFFAGILTMLATYWIWIPILVVLSPIWVPLVVLIYSGLFLNEDPHDIEDDQE